MPDSKIKVALIVFNNVKLLDFAGPLEIFSIAANPPFSVAHPPFPPPSTTTATSTSTTSTTSTTTTTTITTTTTAPDPSRLIFDVTLLSETPTFTTSNGRDTDLFSPAGAPSQYDVVLVPGGSGSRAEMRNTRLLKWLQDYMATAATTVGAGKHRKRKVLMGVCTGSLILAAAGLLDGAWAVTHHAARALLAEAVEGAGGRAEAVAERVVWGVVGIDAGVDVVTCGGVSSGMDAALEVVKEFAGEACARGTAEWIEYEWRVPKSVLITCQGPMVSKYPPR